MLAIDQHVHQMLTLGREAELRSLLGYLLQQPVSKQVKVQLITYCMDTVRVGWMPEIALAIPPLPGGEADVDVQRAAIGAVYAFRNTIVGTAAEIPVRAALGQALLADHVLPAFRQQAQIAHTTLGG